MRWLSVVVPVGVFVIAVLVFASLNRDAGTHAEAAQTSSRLPVAVPGASTDRRIAVLQARVRAGVRPAPLAALGAAYLQKVRETGDAGYYPRADGVLHLALARNQRDADAVVGLGTLALARHDFRRALGLGQRARSLEPAAAGPFPVVVDALVELGRYHDAGRNLQELIDRKPGLPAYARVSYFRELHGDLAGAARAMSLAVSAGSGTPEGAAYVRTLLATLDFNRGRIAAARRGYRVALRAQPRYPAAEAGLARTDAVRGHLPRAIRALRRVVQRLPLPEHIVALGETELAAGRTRAAHADLAVVPVERRLLGARGVNTDVEFALFEADHGDPRVAVSLARRAFAAAPSVRAADALGWALGRRGARRKDRRGRAVHCDWAGASRSPSTTLA